MLRASVAVRSRIVAVLVLALGIAGCGPGKGDVTGVVTYKGQPLQSGQVIFLPEGTAMMATEIGADGRYSLAGVPEGTAKIGVSVVDSGVTQHYRDMSAAGHSKATRGGSKDGPTPTTPKKGQPAPKQFTLIPAKFGDPNGSGLTYEVKSGSQTHNIELQ